MLPSIRRLLSFLRSRRLDDEMAEEIQHHVELRRKALIDSGMNPGEAAYEARRAFGNAAAVKERARDARGLPVLAALLQDLRFGARLIVRSPAPNAAIVLTIALGTGLN